MTQAVLEQGRNEDSVTPAASHPSLTRLAIKGSAWTVVGYGASQVIRLAGNVILSRLLFPEAFGLMALVTAFLVGLEMFSDLGVRQSVIRSRDGDRQTFLDTAWTIQTCRGLGLWLFSCGLAWPAAWVYGEPSLRLLLPVVGATAIISGFTSTKLYALNRMMAFGKLTIIDLGTQIASIAIMIAWAIFHRSVWSLAVGSLAAATLRLAISHLLPGRGNRFHWNRTAARELFSFGQWIFVSTLLTFIGTNSDRFIFGKLGQMSWLGMYSIALALAALPTMVILKIGGAVTFPAYSRIFERGGDLASAFRRSRLPLLVCGGFMVTCVLVAGPSAVKMLYDKRYQDAGLLLQLLALGVWFQVLECTNGALLLAMGESAVVALGNVAKLASMAVMIPIGFHLWGIHGAILGLGAADLGRYLVLAFAVRRRGMGCIGMDLLLTVVVAVATIASMLLLRLLPAHLPGERFTRVLASVTPPILFWIVPAAMAAWEHRAVRDRLLRLARHYRGVPLAG